MIDPVSLAVGAALFGGGVLVGRLMRPKRRAEAPPAEPRPICACGHPVSTHQDNSGSCLVDVDRPHYMKSGDRNGREWVRCACRRYVGPVPMESLWMPAILPAEPGQTARGVKEV